MRARERYQAVLWLQGYIRRIFRTSDFISFNYIFSNSENIIISDLNNLLKSLQWEIQAEAFLQSM